jgi:large subunit ribosomal protein L2
MILVKLRRKINKHSFIYVRTQGGGVKKLYRILDFKGVLQTYLPSIFLNYIYDPCRTAYLSLFVYFNGILSYRVGTDNLESFSLYFPILEDVSLLKSGYIVPLYLIKGGSNIHSVPLIKNSKATLTRSAGLFIYLLRNDVQNRISFIRIRRGLTLIFDYNILVTVGRVCNILHYEFLKGKAGINRLLGKRPVVRGIAMNPVDHPNGGRTPGGKVYRSFSNKIARSAFKTRSKYRFFNRYIKV